MSENRVVFFLTKLGSEELRDEYETWVREVDTPGSIALPGIASYRVVRLEEPVMEGVEVTSYSYIEIIEITDLALYQESIGSLPPSFFEQFRTYISGFDAVAGSFIN
ncbi:hypothetical protein GIS00_02320 [Nakamurella sp. YIM 132087]|uniref:REDY-like protein HapK n=1 Tax=Nakamurella alba TaxID=2665158 RepID=A0A7K1FH37_9ACTN|nr:hypothetical protein [Nakamurella alba]MTD12779.1 hypothetical protein [Nakamurella alba]